MPIRKAAFSTNQDANQGESCQAQENQRRDHGDGLVRRLGLGRVNVCHHAAGTAFNQRQVIIALEAILAGIQGNMHQGTLDDLLLGNLAFFQPAQGGLQRHAGRGGFGIQAAGVFAQVTGGQLEAAQLADRDGRGRL